MHKQIHTYTYLQYIQNTLLPITTNSQNKENQQNKILRKSTRPARCLSHATPRVTESYGRSSLQSVPSAGAT